MSIPKLITNFTTGCWVPCAKALIPFLKTLDKKIPNFQLYFNAKKYNSTNKTNLSDKERYDMLIEQIVEHVFTEEVCKIYTISYDYWIRDLILCLKSNQVYSLLCVNYLKGSYGKMIDDFNRVLLPKTSDDDEPNDELQDPTESVKKNVLYYSQDFIKVLEECVSSGLKLYKSIHLNQEDDDSVICNEMLSKDAQVFSIYSFNIGGDKLYGLWASDKELDYELITLDIFVKLIKDFTFNLNPEHMTNMDTIKRNYVNKQFDLFKSHVNMLTRANSLYFYKGIYSHSADYDSYSELQFTNAVNSFPVSFEDYTKNAVGLFYFDKGVNITVTSYWITSKPVEQILSDYDRGLFTWMESNYEEFLSSSELHVGASFSMLH
jgi:hypothetical protein